MANHLVISNTIELLRLRPEDIVGIEAEGNYSSMHIAGEGKQLILFQLGQVEEMISRQLEHEASAFIRIGRSLIINRHYIYHIHLNKNHLVLRDHMGQRYTFTRVSHESLKKLKALVENTEERVKSNE